MPNTPDDDKRINAIRFLAVDAVQKANSGHPGMPLGAAAAAYALWTKHLRFDPSDPQWFDRDRFVLSAGHASMLLYALLYLTGYNVSLDDLKSFRQYGSKTPGHPESHMTPGVDATTGPLGQGISNAVGMAMAEAHLAAMYNGDRTIVDHRTYVMASDGDLMEGVSSETASVAGHLKLGKLIVLYDDNKVTLSAATDMAFTEDVVARYEAYGWNTQRVEAGNDVAALDTALTAAKNETSRPNLIVVRSHIGFGSPVQDSFKAHGEPLGAENVLKTKTALGWPLEPPFYVPDDVLAWWRENGKRSAAVNGEWKKTYAAWSSSNPALAAQLDRARAGKVADNIVWPTFTAENGSLASRDAGNAAINAVAAAAPELFGGSADLDPSTKTYLKGYGDFQPGNYSGRNVHFGVREHAMGAIANGIAYHGGLLPFTATFLQFLDYMKPAVRLAALSDLRVIFVYTHDSVYLGEDGPTHQPIEHIMHMRATPNLAVIRPADALETVAAWKCAISSPAQPVTLVLSRQKLPFLGERDAAVARGAYVVHGDGDPDVILIATGSEVSLAVDAAKLLDAQRVRTRVVSMPCWEYFAAQDDAYRESVLPRRVRARVSIEAGATLGWERWIGDEGVAIGIDRFGVSAPAADIAKHFGFTPEHVAEVASGLLART